MSEEKQVGRPRKYETPEEFDAKVDEYYHHCKREEEPVTWTGLALYLGFSSRQSIDTYQEYEGFYDSVKRAKTLVEYSYEKRLCETGAAGPIFALKNFGWRDKQEVDLSSTDGTMSPKPAIDASKLSDAALAELMNARSSDD